VRVRQQSSTVTRPPTIGGTQPNENMGRLTSKVVAASPPFKHLVRVRFVPPRRLAHCFVAGGQQDDADQGDDERGGAADVPAAEDDAEVGRVPSEQHLRVSAPYHLIVWSSAAPAPGVQRTFMLHLWPWSMPGMPWSMWP
jgi:hypothetical protein